MSKNTYQFELLRTIVHLLNHVAGERERLVVAGLALVVTVFEHVLAHSVRVGGSIEHQSAELDRPLEQFVLVLVDFVRFQCLRVVIEKQFDSSVTLVGEMRFIRTYVAKMRVIFFVSLDRILDQVVPQNQRTESIHVHRLRKYFACSTNKEMQLKSRTDRH